MTKAQKNTIKSMIWKLTQARQLTHAAHKTLICLVDHITSYGCFPSHDRLAADAGCSRSTVIRSLQAAYALGILKRERRMSTQGHYKVRTSNLYTFLMEKTEQAKQAAQARYQALMTSARRRMLDWKKRQNTALFDLSFKREPEGQTSIYYNNGDQSGSGLQSHTKHLSVAEYQALIASWG